MPKPNDTWFETLPTGRCLAEFSMWSADLCNMAADLARIEAHADILHIDVADGLFAPAFLFFPDLVAAMRKLTAKPIHVHLMVEDAVLLSQIDQFAEAGADLISLHAENALAAEGVARIHSYGLHAGAVLRVESDLEIIAPLVDQLSMVTLLGTAIGVKGQGLNPAAPQRIQDMRAIVAKAAPTHRRIVAADGGIRDTTVPTLVAHGAETVVLGSLGFGAPDLAARMAWLHGLKGV